MPIHHHDVRRHRSAGAAPRPVSGHGVEALQRAAGNAAVTHLIRRAARHDGPGRGRVRSTSVAPVTVSRWVSLGHTEWDTPFGHVHHTLNVGTEDEWRRRLADMDDEDEVEFAQLFLETANDPSIVGRRSHPNGWGGYRNTITRAPNDAEVMAFMRALYGVGDDLDLPNTFAESGPFVRYFHTQFAALIGRYQGRVIQEVSARGQAISAGNVRAVVSQSDSREVTQAMIMNAGATAMKGIDLVKTANLRPATTPEQARAKEVALSSAFETIRNSGRTIKAVLAQHDDDVAFRQAAIGMIFESVWEMIPAGGALASGAKELLKLGLSRALQQGATSDEPREQAERINAEFVQTVNGLVRDGHITAADANGAINGFEAVRA